MNEVELILLNDSENRTIYSIRFSDASESEFDQFFNKFIQNAELNTDLLRIVQILDRIAEHGALERFFRYEGRMSDSVVALPVLKSNLRLYCLRLSDKILILGNGGIKKSQTYNEDDSLRGYVLTLQEFEKLLKEGQRDGSIVITEKTIETTKKLRL